MTNFTELKQNAGKVSFKSSNNYLDEGFEWAKKQALEYAHFGEDPVGLWYEAALPGRASFCMRDVSHQSTAAGILGLRQHTKNMLDQFVKNISASRDYCTYWEITNEGKPTPVDYTGDEDFWYNLPANFDLIRACFLQYLWTGDESYLKDPVYKNFYSKSFCEYINTWDKDGDGIPEHYSGYGRRGIASYNESDLNYLLAGDMIAVQYGGLMSYAQMLKYAGQPGIAEEYVKKAEQLSGYYQKEWWNEKEKRFYGAMRQDRSFYEEYYSEANFLPLLYGIVTSGEKLEQAIRDTIKNKGGSMNVEGMSHVPEMYYRYGFRDEAYKALLKLIDPALERREYPEVSFCTVSSYVTGLMGINPTGRSKVSTLSNLNDQVAWAEIKALPIFNNLLSVKHAGPDSTEICSRSGESIRWKAVFRGASDFLYHNGKKTGAAAETDAMGNALSYIEVEVQPGESHNISQKM